MTLDTTPKGLFDTLSEKKHYLSELLPYDPAIKTGKRLLDGLKELLLLFKAFELTIDALERNELKNFDPLVGENACQIRAVKLAMILSHCTFEWSEFKNQISLGKKKLKALLSSPLLASTPSLKDLIEQETLDIQLSKIELFLIKSYLLTKVKVLKPHREGHPLVKNEYTDTKKIKEISNVGSMFADNFVKNLRERLSLSSASFVQMASLDLQEEPNAEMVSDEFSFDHRGLKCLPCYWTNRILMKQTLNHKIPIVMIAEQKAEDRNYQTVEKAVIFFQLTPQGYKATTDCQFNPIEPALILYGSTCKKFDELPNKNDWIKKLVEHCPMNLMLAYAAAHRQYPDMSKEHMFQELQDPNYEYHKTKAVEWGCSVDNPSRFFLAHAYCDRIENIRNDMHIQIT